MKNIILIFLMLFIKIYSYGQLKEIKRNYETVNQFRDGYAWVQTRDEFHPNADQNYELFHKNSKYTFFTLNDQGKVLLKIPSEGWKYYFPMRDIWVEDKSGIRHIVPLRIDSLLSDVVIKFPVIYNDTLPFEVAFVEDEQKEFVKNKYYSDGNSIHVFYHNNRNIYEDVSGYNPSPTNRVEYHRVFNPPKFVQDFIKKLKKDVLKPITSSKATLYSEINKPTKMYLIKGDEVEILQTKNSWVKIRYYGKTTIEGWIKASDLSQ